MTKLCHIKCNHPACVLADGGHFEHILWTGWSCLIWHNFVKIAGNWIKICNLAQMGTCTWRVKFELEVPYRFGKSVIKPQEVDFLTHTVVLPFWQLHLKQLPSSWLPPKGRIVNLWSREFVGLFVQLWFPQKYQARFRENWLRCSAFVRNFSVCFWEVKVKVQGQNHHTDSLQIVMVQLRFKISSPNFAVWQILSHIKYFLH